MTHDLARDITKDNVEALAQKLRQLAPSLSPGERRALRAIVLRAAESRDDDVQGFKYDDEFPSESAEQALKDLDDFYRPKPPRPRV